MEYTMIANQTIYIGVSFLDKEKDGTISLYISEAGWSDWSEWSTTKQDITDSSLMEEESRIRYGWWAAQCTKCGQNNPFHGKNSKCKSCGITLRNDEGLWKTVIGYTDDISGTQNIFGRNGGRYINGAPYWRESGSNDIIQYRYRTRTDNISSGE